MPEQLDLLASQPMENAPTERSPAGRLATSDLHQWPVQPGWQGLLNEFLVGAQGQSLQRFLAERLDSGAVIYPPTPFKALELTAPEDVRVVILGQDPYHGPGQAQGLAFSVAPGVRLPPSLRNIFKEQARSLGVPMPADGSLIRWALQGVLLINACLTVEDGAPASHAGQGWESLTDAVIRRCGESSHPTVFMLWGAHAQKKAGLIDAGRHLVLSANHPSPLSATRGPVPFMGCDHFRLVNEWLLDQGRSPVTW